MSGTEGDDDRDLLAAEYVLGTLDPLERGYVERQATLDDGLAHLIADWQARLTPLTLLSPPMAPPANLWRRIERATAPARPARTPFWQSIALWRSATGAGFALAAALVIFLVLHPPEVTEAVATLAPVSGGAPVFVAETASDGTLRLQPIAPITVAAGRDLELWSLPAGATRPVSLGVLPANGRNSRLPSLAPRTQLLVSLEPAGGSPTGQPTGPVVYGGTLFRIE